MSARATPRLTAYLVLTALGLLGALASRRAELVVLAAPFALVLAAGLTRRPPGVRAAFRLDADRMLEGDEVAGELVVASDRSLASLEAVLALPHGVDADGAPPQAFPLDAGEERAIPVALRARWGSWTVGDVRLRARDHFGVVEWEARVPQPRTLRVYPRPERLRRLLSPAFTQAATGNELARVRAEGIEFADTRPFVAGDLLRSVNWRASARRGDLVVNERHPERNADVVLFLDSFADAGRADAGILARAVRASATLADLYLRRRDRVGLVSFGGTLRWLEPRAGAVQSYRLVDALLETSVQFSYAWKDVNVLPARVLPPSSLVIAVSPLLDPRAVAALLDLRARGHDLAVVEVPAEPHAAADADGATEADHLAFRLWLLQRDELRGRLAQLGIAVARWDDERPLDAVLGEVTAYRRHARVALR